MVLVLSNVELEFKLANVLVLLVTHVAIHVLDQTPDRELAELLSVSAITFCIPRHVPRQEIGSQIHRLFLPSENVQHHLTLSGTTSGQCWNP